jgi:N-formylglutamate amidohydrolase
MTAFAEAFHTKDIQTDGRPFAVHLVEPALGCGCVIVACPHSGRFYPPELIAASNLDPFTLRRSEDAFVDHLFQDAPSHGAYLMTNTFARAFVDVNRSPEELDPELILDMTGHRTAMLTDRVKAGLGVVPRTVGDNLMIYSAPLTWRDIQARLREVHRVWHENLAMCLNSSLVKCGKVLLLDCHSMPNAASGDARYDIVLGDRFAEACSPTIMAEAMSLLQEAGLKVGRNNPFAGGYATRTYGQTRCGQHALQIEVNRSLYMVEGALTLRNGFDQIRALMGKLVARLVEVTDRM